MNIRYRVTLTADERLELESLIQKGKISARRSKRAFGSSWRPTRARPTRRLPKNVVVGTSTVYRTKQRFVEDASSERSESCLRMVLLERSPSTISSETIRR